MKKSRKGFIKNLHYFCLICVIALGLMTIVGTGGGDSDDENGYGGGRNDGATQISLPTPGSLQNPAWSPDSDELLFTQFKNGYNEEPADLHIINLDTAVVRLLVSDGSGNVNLPGSAWNAATQLIVFSSSREPHDEIFVIDDGGWPGEEQRVTSRGGFMAYEPSFSPDGQWIVFESHVVDMDDNGVITKCKADGSGGYVVLTDSDDDCRQPNWAHQGDHIVYQRLANGQWDLWVMDTDGANKRQITSGTGDKTDASFSPDGTRVVYSSDEDELEFANLFIIPVTGGASTRITNYTGYDGAPSWSPDGKQIVFESYPGDPDGSPGTSLWVIDAQDLY
jgi:TolB protein